MGLFNSKSNCLCSESGGRVSTLEETLRDFTPVREAIIIDYEITEFERCDENYEDSPVSYSNTGFSSKVTVTSPMTPYKYKSGLTRTKVLSRNASISSINIVDSIRNLSNKDS